MWKLAKAESVPTLEGSTWVIVTRDDIASPGSKAVSRTNSIHRNMRGPTGSARLVSDGVAVHQQVHGTAAWPGTHHVQHLGAAAQGRVVRHREIEAEQGDDGADQPFGLTQRQAEHRPQRQRYSDRQSRVARLAASRGSGLRLPRRDGRVDKPDEVDGSPLTTSQCQGRLLSGQPERGAIRHGSHNRRLGSRQAYVSGSRR